ncbi:MAG: U32 family peptidase, partial [Methanobacterium sp.]|nr:U32 family peptidase [Methanobacterium sp.]
MEKKSKPELLAPAGSMDSLKAAVNAGADAVYLSGKSFGARYYADNFNEVQMVKALEYAHFRDVKVYVTVNTLILDGELEKVAEYLLWLYKVGADAVIIQDIGVASLCRELIPDLDLHASTQMTINSAHGVKWAYESGFKRVILARELSFPELEEIVQEIDGKVELEIFAHGALCYGYSGQCLLSSFIGGRSGNRGRCAQPCRKPYQLLQGTPDEYGKITNTSTVSSDENYLLSTRDLALYPDLEKITKIPLTSLKIEGRMRSPEYVAIVVSTYRKALDDLSNKKWLTDEKELKRLKLAFNRKFTKGYLLENNYESVMGRDAPGNRGLYLGIANFNKSKKKVLLELNQDLSDFILEKGDGIVFLHPETSKQMGMTIETNPEYINSHKVLLETKKPVYPGSKVYLTRDNSLSREAKNIIIQKDNRMAIPLEINMKLDKNNIPILKGKFTRKDIKSFDVNFKADFSLKPAVKSPLSKKQIINQLKKTGGTPFLVKDVEVNYSGNLFAPLSKLNAIRREFIKKAEYTLLNSYKPPITSVESAEKRLLEIRQKLQTGSTEVKVESKSSEIIVGHKSAEKTVKKSKSEIEDQKIPRTSSMEVAVYSSSLETIKGALKGGSKRIYFEPFIWEHFKRRNPCKAIRWTDRIQRINGLLIDALELCTAHDATLIWKWPSLTNDESLINLISMIK